MTASPQRVALMGGTFDPPHIGHFLLAQDVLERGDVQRLMFVPAGRNPLKPGSATVSGAHRLGMLRAAVAGDPRFDILDVELRREGPSYTIDTVDALQHELPNVSLAWVIGSDQLDSLHRWRDIDRLSRAVEFLVVRRPGSARARPSLPNVRWRVVSERLISISSTEIRDRRHRGKPIDFFVPPRVLNYIEEHRLYREL